MGWHNIQHYNSSKTKDNAHCADTCTHSVPVFYDLGTLLAQWVNICGIRVLNICGCADNVNLGVVS